MEIPAPPPKAPPENEKPSDVNVASQQVQSPHPYNRSPVPPRRDGVPPRPNAVYHSRQNSLDDDSDRFDEMPDSEVNIVKKVKVMMGRGQELESAEGETVVQGPLPPGAISVEQTASVKPDDSTVGSGMGTEQVSLPQVVQPHYLVAAAVIEEESPLVRPYKDDILKLVIRLPVEGQTQNVQFDFHLIEDDPVQVAKEMVTELGIPQDAILEISETISGHARNARMRQEKYISRQQWQQEPPMTQNIQGRGMQHPGVMQLDNHSNQQQWQQDQQMAQCSRSRHSAATTAWCDSSSAAASAVQYSPAAALARSTRISARGFQ